MQTRDRLSHTAATQDLVLYIGMDFPRNNCQIQWRMRAGWDAVHGRLKHFDVLSLSLRSDIRRNSSYVFAMCAISNALYTSGYLPYLSAYMNDGLSYVYLYKYSYIDI